MSRVIAAPGIVKNIDRYLNTMRNIPFTVAVSDWVENNGTYTAEFLNSYISESCFVIATYSKSILEAKAGNIEVEKKTGGGGMIFTSNKLPIGSVTGNLYVWDNNDGKVPFILEDTVVPIENGGTGASNLAGAQDALGITALNSNITSKADKPVICSYTGSGGLLHQTDALVIATQLPSGYTVDNSICIGAYMDSYDAYNNNTSSFFYVDWANGKIFVRMAEARYGVIRLVVMKK